MLDTGLLDAELSPFGQALTKNQCSQYALDKPGVLTVLPGFRGPKDLKDVLGSLAYALSFLPEEDV